jgi:hypothetical protein
MANYELAFKPIKDAASFMDRVAEMKATYDSAETETPLETTLERILEADGVETGSGWYDDDVGSAGQTTGQLSPESTPICFLSIDAEGAARPPCPPRVWSPVLDDDAAAGAAADADEGEVILIEDSPPILLRIVPPPHLQCGGIPLSTLAQSALTLFRWKMALAALRQCMRTAAAIAAAAPAAARFGYQMCRCLRKMLPQ